jgi:hypothetical protein
VLEYRYDRDVERAHGLPRAARGGPRSRNRTAAVASATGVTTATADWSSSSTASGITPTSVVTLIGPATTRPPLRAARPFATTGAMSPAGPVKRRRRSTRPSANAVTRARSGPTRRPAAPPARERGQPDRPPGGRAPGQAAAPTAEESSG